MNLKSHWLSVQPVQTKVLLDEANFESMMKQDGQLPQAYFPTSKFAKDTLLKDESIFLEKNHYLQQI